MKKYIALFGVLVLALAIIAIARNNPVWASGQPSGVAVPPVEITVTESGSYTVGGLCEFNAVYTGSGASATVAVDVPPEESRKVPFSYDGDLYLAGCHIVHSVLDEVKREMSPTYGSWEVCFGDRPDEQLTIYYYLDDPEDGSPVWAPLTTTAKDGLVCAPAMYTGVYAPGGRHPEAQADNPDVVDNGGNQGGPRIGTVRPKNPTNTGEITKSGTYGIGGLCTLVVEYYRPNMSDVVTVEKDIEVSANVPFPDNEGLLYLPGCHVYHYRNQNLTMDVTKAEGKWKICFAAIPNKETRIFYYYAKDSKPESAIPDWTPLETTIEGGMACAPLTNQTAVYAPVGK
jgi:hypothetical protein